MPDYSILPVATTPAVPAVVPIQPTQPVQPIQPPIQPAAPVQAAPAHEQQTVAATTSGGLSQAYAQFVVDPDTHDVVIRIVDSSTNQLISETPSAQVQEISKSLLDYAANLARRHAASLPKAPLS